MVPDSANPIGALAGARLKGALLERLRFEQALGIESVPRASRPLDSCTPSEGQQAGGTPVRPRTTTVPVGATGGTPVLHAAPVGVDLFTPAIDTQKERINATARWKELEARAVACTACGLHKGRTNVVFGCGSRTARLLFVGEGPGQDEDLQGLPFVGRAGQLLNKIIAAMGLKREEVYICNIVKCRPPENRTPLPDEVAACCAYLFEQIELVAPRVIVALGAPAAKTLLNTTQGIMSMRGHWYNFRGIPVMPTYHPAFVLRRYTEEVRRAVWEDMKQVMAKLKEGGGQ